jgi:hypothetical protein
VAVRESRTPVEELVGGRTKAAVLRELRRGSDTLSGVARRIGGSKGAVFAALGSLERAGLVERSAAGRYGIAAAHGALVDAIVALDVPPGDPGTTPMEQHRGQWVAVDADYAVLAGDDDPRELVAEIRARGLRPHGIMRVPARGDPPFEGAQGQ